MLFSGAVEVVRENGHGSQWLARLVPGDYFGEESLLAHKRTNATVRAIEETVLLCLTKNDFNIVLKQMTQLKANFSVAVSSHRLARSMKFRWLREEEGEVIYFLARKHQIMLYRALLFPVLAALFVSLGIVIALNIPSNILLWIFIVALGLVIGWGFWSWVDWGNDYYIVTNQRVIWLEKVVGFYDSRTEASLGTILSVSTETDYFGRIYDFGIVIVRTYTGQIRMDYVRHPKQCAAMIEEHLGRTKESGRKADEETMKQAIRAKLGLNKPPVPGTAVTPAPLPAKPVKPLKKQSALSAWWQNAFNMRTVDGNTITYHKHI